MSDTKSLRLLTPDFGKLRRHFSPPALIAVAAALVIIFGPSGSAGDRALLALAAAFAATLAASLYAQSRDVSAANELLLQAAAGGAAAGLGWFANAAALSGPALIGGLALACVAAPVHGLKDPESYWIWAARFCTIAVVAFLEAGIAHIATYATISSASALFGFTVPSHVFGDIAALFLVAGAAILFLALQPPLERASTREGFSDFAHRVASSVASWTLAPFVLIYSALLWLYAGKIVLLGDLPDREIGWMVGLFGLSALGTIFLIFPQRESGPRQTRLLWRVWPYLAIAPLALLAIAIYQRIEAHGLTTDRYLASLLALLCACAALVAARSRDAVIRFAPAAGALALIAASFGPWGARATAIRWQDAALRNVYAARGLLNDSVLVVADQPPDMPASEARRCRGAVDFLSSEGRLAPLLPPGVKTKLPYSALLCGEKDIEPTVKYRYFNLTGNWFPAEPLENAAVIGYLQIYPGSTAASEVKAEIGDGRVTITWRGATAIFDLNEIEKRFDVRGSVMTGAPVLKPAGGDQRFFFLLDQMSIKKNAANAPKLSHLKGFLMRKAN